jgi:hypothetical protein
MKKVFISLISMKRDLNKEKFLEWMRFHIKKITDTGLFNRVDMIVGENDADGANFCLIIYSPKSAEAWETYEKDHRPAMKAEFSAKWKEGALETGALQPAAAFLGVCETVYGGNLIPAGDPNEIASP